jgi:hypothetical protein
MTRFIRSFPRTTPPCVCDGNGEFTAPAGGGTGRTHRLRAV